MPQIPAMTLTKDGMAALLLLAAFENTMNAYSSLNSSPWTAESFGGDPDKSRSNMEYVYHSIGITAAMAGLAAWVAGSWWPIIGMIAINVYMFWLYRRANARAAARGSTGW
jgi:uncharacterized membrane protein